MPEIPPGLVDGDMRVAFIVKLGQALHRYGTPTHRLEHGMDLVMRKLGLAGQFFATPTGIFASFGPPEEQRTALIRVEPSESDLEKLARLDELVNQVIRGEMTVTQGLYRIEAIIATRDRYGPLMSTFCFALGSVMFARFLGGGWRELLVTGLIGTLLGGLAIVMGRRENTLRVLEPVAGVVSAATAVVLAQWLHPLSIYIATLSSLIVLVPGLTVTIAIRELATRNLVAGTARLTGAVLVFFQLGFGVALGWQVARVLPTGALFTAVEPLPSWTVGLA
ncbi:MAG: threonine/serine exporter family protein, partial [Pyrinomonadaceae bacterium]